MDAIFHKSMVLLALSRQIIHRSDMNTLKDTALALSVAAASTLLVATAYAASFDCRQAHHLVERIVCADSGLSKLDDTLSAVWLASQTACADPTQMRLHAQQAWMADVRNEARYYSGEKAQSRVDAESAYANVLRDRYQWQIEALRQQTEECQWLSARNPSSASPVIASPLDCSHPQDVVEQGICRREYIREPAQKLHAAFASAVAACADSQVRWRDPLTELLANAKRTAQANEERYGVRYTPENVEFGNIHTQLDRADEPWNELKDFCQRTPLAERRSVMRITNASKQLEFTIKQLSYTPGDVRAQLAVQDKTTKHTLLAFDLPSIARTMEGGSVLVNSARLYEDQGTINVGDFNFDGQDDFAVQVGLEGSYGGPNYAVFLRASNGFIHNQRMSDLTREGLGFFGFDAETRTLSTFSKSGCCDHWSITYKVMGNQPVPVRMSRDALSADGMGRIEESVYTGGRWKKVKVRAYRPANYCEEALSSAGEEVLLSHRAVNYNNTPLCSLLPGTKHVGVWFTLMPTLKPSQKQWDGALPRGDWGVYMAVAHTDSEAVLARYANPAQFASTYASSEDTMLDEKTFASIGSDPVWSLVQGLEEPPTSQSGESATRLHQLNLFRWNRQAERIDNILVNLVTRLEAGKTVVLRKLAPSTTRHHGMSDLVVEEVRFAKTPQPGPLPKDAQKQHWVLQFDGDRYPLPPALAQAP